MRTGVRCLAAIVALVAAVGPVRAEPAGAVGGAAAASSAAGSRASSPAGSPVASRAGDVPDPETDPFYDPPPGFEAEAPGTVLRSRPITVTGLRPELVDEATQLLVRTTDTAGAAVATAATVVVPPEPGGPHPGGARPLVAYQPFTDGLAARCEPSHELQAGGMETELALLAPLLSAGYVVVVPDHQGPRHAYGAGIMAGHATLDGIRAAQSLPGTGLDGRSTPVGMWGYSGGAIATGWAAELQPSYAPELAVVGAASGGTAADFLEVARWMDGGPFSSIMLMVLTGLGREYPEYRHLANEAGLAVEADLADDCLEEGGTKYPFRRLADLSVLDDPLRDPQVIELSRQVRMGDAAPAAPVLLYHGLFDEGIPFAQANRLRDDWCASGGDVVFRPVLGEHLTTMVTEAPAVYRFLADRFAGAPVTGGC